MEKPESNYEAMKHQMQEKFSSWNLSRIAREWELETENDYLLLTFVGRQYKINRNTGAVFYEQDGVPLEADYNVSMTLFDILTRERPHASGIFKSSSSFSTVHSAKAPSGSMFDAAAQRFDHRDAELSAACERLGGVKYGKGDVGYIIPVFQDLRVAIQFWDSDEEFGPSLNLLCDGNILSYMHFETMMFLLIHLVERLAETIC